MLNQQAEDARVLIEGYSGFWVELPDLVWLLKATGVIFEELLGKVPLFVKWHLLSIQHLVKGREKTKDTGETKNADAGDGDEGWIKLYGKGEEEEAEKNLILELARTEERPKRARLYNDLGYIRCGDKVKKYTIGRKDLETAFDLHYSSLPLTLLNLGYLDIDEGNYDKGIEKIEAALLLSISPVETSAAYLRLRLPDNHLGFRVRCEQHPANVIEAAYINLAYSILKSKGYEEALKVIEEGSELFPSSIRLRHALARFYIHKRRVDLALPIYKELSQAPSMERYMGFEVGYFQRHIGKKKRGEK